MADQRRLADADAEAGAGVGEADQRQVDRPAGVGQPAPRAGVDHAVEQLGEPARRHGGGVGADVDRHLLPPGLHADLVDLLRCGSGSFGGRGVGHGRSGLHDPLYARATAGPKAQVPARHLVGCDKADVRCVDMTENDRPVRPVGGLARLGRQGARDHGRPPVWGMFGGPSLLPAALRQRRARRATPWQLPAAPRRAFRGPRNVVGGGGLRRGGRIWPEMRRLAGSPTIDRARFDPR